MSSPPYLIGFDLGTSAIKAILTDTQGTILAMSSRRVSLIHLESLRYEIDPERYFEDLVSVLAELVTEVGDEIAGGVRAISMCAASGNTIVLDQEHRPIRNTISWMDRRSVDRQTELWPDLETEHLFEQVGWPFGGGFPLGHLLWIRDFEPENWTKARYFTMNNDYVYYRLSGRLVVDPSKATTFYLQDQITETWNSKLLDYIGISEAQLSEIVPSGTAVGTLDREIAKRTGLPEATQIVTGSFDHPSAARSTGIFEVGDLLISAGTSWVVFAPVSRREVGLENQMIIDPFLSPEGNWAVMSSLTAVAARIDELLEAIFETNDGLYPLFDSCAMRSEIGARGLRIDPWEQKIPEVLAEAREASKDDLCRAIMEGCAFLLKHRIVRLQRILNQPIRRLVMVGGPTKSPVWPEILAAVLGIEIRIPATGAHAGALGAAILGGVGVGIYSDVREGSLRVHSAERVITPENEAVSRYRPVYVEFSTKFGYHEFVEGAEIDV